MSKPRDGYWLGIDPGTSGAWALVRVVGGQPEGVAGCSWRWSRRKAGKAHHYAWPGGAESRASLRPSVASQMLGRRACAPLDGVALEGLFAAGGKLHGVLTLAETAGWWLAQLDAGHYREPVRPLAQRWRRELLGIGPQTPRAKCDEVVAAWAGEVPGPPGWQEWAGSAHAHDAVAMAVWCAMFGEVGNGD